MYKFNGINLDHLINLEVEQIRIGPHSIHFDLENDNYITIEGKWKIIDKDGNIFDHGDAKAHNENIKIHNLLLAKIVSYKILNPKQLEISFSNGKKLIIIDDSDEYECCAISPNIYI
jgi:hypothetical protein